MKYEQPTFTVPVGSNKVTQAEWDRIFMAHEPKPVLDEETQTYHCGTCGEPLDEGKHLSDRS